MSSELPATEPSQRITSIDALRGLVMFTMIFVNDLAGAPHKLVPDWMVHFSDRHRGSGMTFVDLVFPAFLFIVGMSIPFAIRSRLERGGPLWKNVLQVLGHVLVRTAALIMLGVIMVNGSPNSEQMGWSSTVWTVLMYTCAILAFCSISPWRKPAPEAPKPRFTVLSKINLGLRLAGLVGLIALALMWRGGKGQQIVTFSPFAIRHSWYGILGLIGWAYLVASLVFLLFGTYRTGLLMCMVLLMCLFPAERKGLFGDISPVSIGETLGSQATITVGGVLLASVLLVPWNALQRVGFAGLFILGCSIAAILLNPLYGISKNNATPSWCLWSCAITAALWVIFYLVADVWPTRPLIKPLALAGSNVLLAYLLSEMLGSVLELIHLDDWYGRLAETNLSHAVSRSAGCAFVILLISVVLNRVGFRLRL
jgi:predicted acyltransferase